MTTTAKTMIGGVVADSKAALDRVIAEAEERGMRKALDAASDYTQRVYGAIGSL